MANHDFEFNKYHYCPKTDFRLEEVNPPCGIVQS